MALLSLILVLASAVAQPTPARDCLDVRDRDADISLEGRLDQHVYPGPPNYASVRRRDRAESAYILTLERPICIDDGGDFADPGERFSRVHLYTSIDANWRRLRAGIGRRVRVQGSGFAAHTAHHREPLVVDVRAIRIEGR